MYGNSPRLLQNLITGLFIQKFRQTHRSVLFIPGHKRMEIYSAVTPYLDFDEQLKDIQKLEENMNRRQLNHDIHDLKSVWEFYKTWKEAKCKVEDNRIENATRIKEISKWQDGDEKDKEIKRLSVLGKLLRDDLKSITQAIEGIEENVILRVLSLPNKIHSDTPLKAEVIKEFKQKTFSGKNHLNVGTDLGYLDYKNEKNYYLKNKAALFDLATLFYFTEHFVKKNFTHFSSCDFARNVLVEGVGLNANDTTNVFLLNETEGNNDKLYLSGSASLFPFCGFHSKQISDYKHLPVRYVASGQIYSPACSTHLKGLYSVWQSSSVQVFIGTDSESNMNLEYKHLLSHLIEAYADLNLHIRIVSQPPECLKPWESLKTSIQILSTYHNEYIEVGHITIIDDYISKRLRMSFEERKQERFLKVVSGNIVNVASLLAICLEQSTNDLHIPEVIAEHMLGL